MRGSTSGAERRVADGPRPPDGRSEAEALIRAARHVLERRGGDGFTVHEVLGEAGLGTRAFYRHFSSKEALVLAVFAEGAQRERARLEARMAGARSPTEAVTAWIESRLELAFDDEVADSMRVLSLEAQLAVEQAPEQLEAAFDSMLAPLIRQLAQGRQDGSFSGVDPERDARALHDVVWGETQRQWTTPGTDPDRAHRHVLRFCLRAIGAELAEGH